MLKFLTIIVLGFTVSKVVSVDPFQTYVDNVKFMVLSMNENRNLNIVSNSTEHCDPTQKWAIIVHGWTETFYSYWVSDLAKNFIKHRGGCVMYMDYAKYSVVQNYFTLVSQFQPLSTILLNKLIELESKGFDPKMGFLFGFSFGARLVMDAARKFGVQKIKEIDLCDPAGPGFDNIYKFDPKLSAENVQCIHTSIDKGTRKRECHQDWLLGNCGNNQVAQGPYPKGSHGLCPAFYNSAFDNDFLATHQKKCWSNKRALVPEGYKMGYMESRKWKIRGELFATTTKFFPYNA